MIEIFSKEKIYTIIAGFFALLTLCVPPRAAAQGDEKITAIDRPDWVTLIEPTKGRDERQTQVQDGTYYLVFDTQVRLYSDYYEFYRHTAIKVSTRAGLEDAGRLQFSFDPFDEEFRVHSIRIIRDEEIIDRLEPEKFLVTRRESDLQNGVTDGELTGYYEIPNVQVGDIVDYEISWKTQSPLWMGAFSADISTAWSVPIDQYQYRIVLPAGRELTIVNNNNDIEPDIKTTGGLKEYVWALRDPEPKSGEDLTPQDYANWGYVSVSTFAQWAGVTQTLIAPYEDLASLPADFAQGKSWLSKEIEREQQITAAIRYVQDEIRYVADETGVGSHIPRSPGEVIARGWGDCKDKALLLVAILREIGAEAYVALVDNDSGFALKTAAPSPFAFDHAIVAIAHEGDFLWIDATDQLQGGIFPEIAQPAYGYGLLIREDDGDIRAISPKTGGQPFRSVKEIYDYAGYDEDGIGLEVVTQHRGRAADSFRSGLSNSSPSQYQENYFDYYEGNYPGIEARADLRIEDNRDENVVITREQYHFPRAAFVGTDIENVLPLRADGILGNFDNISLTSRTAPIGLPFPINAQHIYVFKNAGDNLDAPDDVEVSTDQFSYERKSTSTDEQLTISYWLQTASHAAPLADAVHYKAVLDDPGRLRQYGFHLLWQRRS